MTLKRTYWYFYLLFCSLLSCTSNERVAITETKDSTIPAPVVKPTEVSLYPNRLILPFKFALCSDDKDITGIFPDTSNFFIKIEMIPADCVTPVLKVYNKSGTLISESTITSGNVAFDCGYYCYEFLEFRKDQSVLITDSIITYDCDSLGAHEETKRTEIKTTLITIDDSGNVVFKKITD